MTSSALTPWSDNKANQTDVLNQIARMSALPSRSFRNSQSEFMAAQTAYFDVLVGIDLAVLDHVIGKFNAGDFIEAGQSEQWFPSPAAIMVQCKRVVSKLAEDRARRREYQTSFDDGRINPELSPEAKARMSAMWSKTKNENAAADPEKAHNTPEAARERLEAQATLAADATFEGWLKAAPNEKLVDRWQRPSIDLK